MSQGRLSAARAPIAAISSMRLLVVSGSPPDSSFSRAPARITAPQPPGPGLPLQAPSVKISTLSKGSGGGFEAVGQLEHHPLDDACALALGDVEMGGEEIDHFAHQRLGRRGAGGDAEVADAA